MRSGFIILMAALVFSSCGSDSYDTNENEIQSTIKNPVVENVIPYGLSTFALGVPSFPLEDTQTSEGIGYKSVAKVVRHIATNELYTFTEKPDHAQVKAVLKSFIDAGHQVTHEIYILSGPAMRRCADWWLNGVVGKEVCDEDFVYLLQYDLHVRYQTQLLFIEAVEHARVLESYGVNVLICPELEDNHENKKSYSLLIDALHNAGWTDNSKIVRNGGKMGDFGVRYETHSSTVGIIQWLREGDIYNNDGNTYYLASDEGSQPPGAISEERIRSMLRGAQERGVIIYLWYDILQGLNQAGPGHFIYPSLPRTYTLRKPAEQAAILLGVKPEEVVTIYNSDDSD